MGFGAANVAVLRQLSAGDAPLAVGGAQQSRPTTTLAGTSAGDELAGPTTSVVATPTSTAGVDPVGPPIEVDIAITGGRVIDPETGLDGVFNVGINGETITTLADPGQELIARTRTIDATGMVVSPGFIDILSYEPNPYGIWFKVADGVTSNVGMHGINKAAADFVEEYTGQTPCNYGGAFDSAWVRGRYPGEGIGIGDEAVEWRVGEIADRLRADLSEGFIGLAFETEYTPGVESYTRGQLSGEQYELCRVAQEVGAAAYFHVRYSDPVAPGTNAEALTEVIDLARDTGVSVHIDHLTSTGGTHTMEASLSQIDDARSEGLDITACVYPYTFWATTLGAARFYPGWQDRFRIGYDDLRVPGQPDLRITEANFSELQSQNLLVAAMGAIPEAELAMALQTPWVIVASDAILEPANNNHPRSTGTFARTLGRLSRDQGLLSLPDAVAKMTILPARRLQGAAPRFARKGRIQAGMDADITIFDPTTVIDRSQVGDPAIESTGINWVIVNGTVVRENGRNLESLPGRAITSSSA
jgi:N-acyl-D-aspartate/D-glutamate deacylase